METKTIRFAAVYEPANVRKPWTYTVTQDGVTTRSSRRFGSSLTIDRELLKLTSSWANRGHKASAVLAGGEIVEPPVVTK